ncbi:MAG TPA: UDP-N-acetylmuramate--L-alanine ligase [Candidatus Deferrimicrobium sp.]|nr:UDP-N-acetylmuramate--L-alanine ligase [Candidatus Deferrimicrobium sp.]
MIKYSRIKRIHFVGIGGVGMSGIAEVLHNMGFIISGSDIRENESVKRLKSMGVTVLLGHSKDHIEGAETLVYSSAVTKDNEEVREALKRKIPVIPRAEMLGELMRVKFAIAVGGTHGKTTTTSMIATILTIAGKDPTYVVGGKLKIEESGAKLGKSDYLVAEADESDGSFLSLFHTLGIITNIEDDHLDYHKTMANLVQAFIDFGDKVPFYGSVILNYDCPNANAIISRLNKRVITYSLTHDADIRAQNIEHSLFGATFDLVLRDREPVKIHLNVGGLHNVSNALAAIAAALEIGIEIPLIQEAFRRFYLPERRFQVLFYTKDYLVIDDYAHHPTEISAALQTLAEGKFKRIIAVFQPHRFTRLERLMDRFTSCFDKADQLILAEIYKANQEEIKNVNSRVLAEKIKASGYKNVIYIEDFDEIITYLEKNIKKGDAVAFLSAGNLTQTAHEFAKHMEARRQ